MELTMNISIVAPAFNEAGCIEAFVYEISLLRQKFSTLELIIVDDGSTDATWQIIQSIASKEAWVVGTRLTRNYGHQIAVIAGLHKSTKELIAIIDIDLQDPPQLIYDMAIQIAGDVEIVYGQRRLRHGESSFKKNSAKIFYRLLNKMTEFELPLDTGDFRIITRRVMDYVLSISDNRPFLRGYFAYSGYKAIPFTYDRQERFSGSTKYPLKKMMQFALSAFLSFSAAPFNLALYLAIVVAFLSTGGGVFFLLLGQVTLRNFLITLAFIFFSYILSGILIFIFLLGKYLEGVHILTKKIPLYLEK